MLPKWLTFLPSRALHRRRLRAVGEAILERLEEQGSLVLDRAGIDSLDTTRKLAFQAVYHLVINERAYMRATPQGQVVVMSADEFTRFMLNRAEIAAGTKPMPATPHKKSRRTGRSPSPSTTSDNHTPVFASTPLDSAGEFDWFQLEIAQSERVEERRQLPPFRQTLPNRERDPWDAPVFSSGNEKEKEEIF